MGKTNIEWTDHSINPIRARNVKTGAVGHYCEKISSGCAHCYASALQKRFKMPEFPGKRSELPADIEPFLDESKLQEVLRRKKPTKYFWCDMTDMFGWWVPDEWIDRCFAVMALTPQHTHMVLTKRPERMAEWLCDADVRVQNMIDNMESEDDCPFGDDHAPLISDWPLPNVWPGTSIENQQQANERLPHLLRCPAAIRFLSVEPMLGPVEFSDVTNRSDCIATLGKPALDGIGWVIVGCESRGKKAGRLPGGTEQGYWDAARSLMHQCKAAGVAFFHKQGPVNGRVSHDPDEWPEDMRVRQFPQPVSQEKRIVLDMIHPDLLGRVRIGGEDTE